MAIINKTGITNGSTIQAAHVTRAIDALSGGSTDTIVATGSFSGSVAGEAVTAKTLAIGPTSQYSVVQSAGNVIFNAANDTLDTTIKHQNGAVSSSLLFDGLTVNGKIRATSFTGSLQGTASFASIAATASYVLQAVSASFATTASYALNAGGSGTGFPFTGSAQVTGSMGITGSLNVTAGVTASLFGTASRAVTASFADLSRQVLVQRTAVDADHFMVIVDSGNATPIAESLNTVTNMRVNPGTDTISAVTVTGSFNVTGSMSAVKFATVDLRILGQASSGGQLAIPIQQTGGTPLAGSIYWNDSTGTLYIYSATNASWYNVQLNP
jgi:hypothetical protein